AATAAGRHEAAVPGSIRAGFPQQERILRDAVDYVAHSPYVDSSRIGVVGLAGALRGNAIPETNHLAPTRELHGAHDPVVPVGRARALADTLKHLGVPYELKIYPSQGH